MWVTLGQSVHMNPLNIMKKWWRIERNVAVVFVVKKLKPTQSLMTSVQCFIMVMVFIVVLLIKLIGFTVAGVSVI